jgi:hypothetical protein
MLRELAPNLWTVDAGFRHGTGLELGCRATIVRLPDGRLWVHSPVRFEPADAEAIDALGPVAYLVAPNYVHYLFVGEAHARWPEAEVHATRKLERKLTTPITATLDDGGAPWAGAIDQVYVDGAPGLRETAFLHRATRTLILADLLCCFDEHSAPSARLAARIGWIYGRPAFPHVLRYLFVKDNGKFREGIAKIAAWEFERIVVAHGSVTETHGKEAFESAYAWLV